MQGSSKDWTVGELISRCSLRPVDELAWEEFVRRFHNVIKSTVGKTFRRRVRDETDRQEQFRDDATEDLIQTVYHRLLEDRSAALRRFGGAHDNSIYQYLMMISINVVRDYFREAKAQKRPRVSHSLDDVLSRETAGTVCSEVAGHIGRLPSGDHNQVTMDE
ncbi:MAG TPA: hypothetical protein VJX67_00415, partial [Blastocatellia bacterium]|nr:hypothetical protein [Blastocatellia bacterium]